ncbi:septum formation family protein [Arthrobacter globiformis]|uniref:septum formation family protein n=1 Tax=Arthrobacter globiformis TaxID=1665 RepID=UPI000B4213A4|nr:septum formation family protein [Arthrobacter globiformis]
MNDNDPNHDGERGPAHAVAVHSQQPAQAGQPARPEPAKPEPAQPAAEPTSVPAASRLTSLVGSIQSRLRQPGMRQTLPKIGFVLALLVVGGLLVWLLTSLLATATMQSANRPAAAADPTAAAPPAPAASPRPSLPLASVSPLDFRVGDCFKDFDPEAAKSTVVACTTDHSAQLVAVTQYADGDAYPGREAMKTKARETCQTAALTEKSNAYNLNYRLAYPSTSSWAKGDRRVDCYVTASGNIIKASLLP